MFIVYITLILITAFLSLHLTNVLQTWSELSPLERAKTSYTSATFVGIYLLLCLGAGILTWH